jgi:hypothetical protein
MVWWIVFGLNESACPDTAVWEAERSKVFTSYYFGGCGFSVGFGRGMIIFPPKIGGPESAEGFGLGCPVLNFIISLLSSWS